MIRFRLDSTPIQHISRYRKHLQTHPLLVLDAHMTFFDIGITAKHIHATLKPTRIVGPIAAYLLYIPGLGQYIRHFAKKYSIVLFPVYRKDELAPKGLV